MSIYKRFRYTPARNEDRQQYGDSVGSGGFALSPRFDQPSYLSFRLIFGEADSYYNNAASGDYILNYDIMPHPLFENAGDPDVFNRKKYSAVSYLRDANEFTRANMLENFITLWSKLQYNYQWYFQKIDGVNDLLKIDPLKGQRVTSDKRLSITVLEGIDLRLSHLMNLYRKIVWDDTYQRWVLPDMMRYFTLDIYISEFRTFHTPSPYSGYGIPEDEEEGKLSPSNLKLNILDDILPVWKIRCEMCEFDIQSVNYDHLSSLGVDETPGEAGVKFDIKVGKMYEEQIYPTFKNAFLIDKALNGLDRSKEEEIGGGEGTPSSVPFDSTSSNTDINNNTTIHNNKLYIAYAQNQTFNRTDMEHLSGAAYNEQTNKLTINDQNAGNLWFNNAANQGRAFLENRFEKVLDRSKITPIPGLGISFTEVKAALQGKNIITALGLIRKGVNEVVSQYAQPSELLEGEIYSDDAFRTYLEGVSKSEATNELEVSLVEAANIALNDNTILSQIRDFSRATSMTGEGETNDPNNIESGGAINQTDINSAATSGENNLNTTLNEPGESTIDNDINDGYSQGDVISEATEGSLTSENNNDVESDINKKIPVREIYEGVPTSKATSNKLQNG